MQPIEITVTDNYNRYDDDKKGKEKFSALCDELSKQDERELSEQDRKTAFQIIQGHLANKTVGEMVKENPSLLIFPHALDAVDSDLAKSKICEAAGSFTKLSNAYISTGNLMGFVGCRSEDGDIVRLNIRSRFSSELQPDWFLHYMIQTVFQKMFAFDVLDLPSNAGDTGELDFLLYAFPALLQKALSQGLYKTYQSYKRNDANVKGAIDVPRHIRRNVPFCGKIAYNSRESSYDNSMTQLVRHTIEYIKTRSFGKPALSANAEIRNSVRMIIDATQTYARGDRNKIIAKNLKPFAHPYYTFYRDLQELCLMILRHDSITYGAGENEVYGILFDGAWLWEEYLNAVLEPCGFTHARYKDENPIYVFRDKSNGKGERFPDFYEYKGEQTAIDWKRGEMQLDKWKDNVILDAKYKRIKDDDGSIKRGRDDIHQIITYMHILPAQYGALIYPNDTANDNDSFDITPDEVGEKIHGLGGRFSAFGVPIPQNETTSDDFRNKMQTIEKKLRDYDWAGAMKGEGLSGQPPLSRGQVRQ